VVGRFHELSGYVGGKTSAQNEYDSMVGGMYKIDIPTPHFMLLTLVLPKINTQRYGPVWTTIAQDYLVIMASSVSSERTFSQGGITISKCHNHLKGDIIKAIQCVKCAICHDLLFHEPGPSSLVKDEPDELEFETEPGENSEGNIDEEGWDTLFLEENDDDLESDDEIDKT
jgi:hypothetical protein